MERFKKTLIEGFLILLTLVYGECFSDKRNEIRFIPCNISEEKKPGVPLQQCVKIFNLQKTRSDKLPSRYNKLKIPGGLKKKDDGQGFPKNIPHQWLFQSISRAQIDKISEAILWHDVELFEVELKKLVTSCPNFSLISISLNKKPSFSKGFRLAHVAVISGGTYSLYFMKRLAMYRIDWNAVGPNNMTALGIAVEERNVEVVKWLIPLSQKTLNQKMGKKDENLIFLAVYHFHPTIFSALLEAKVMTNVSNAEKATPLHKALQLEKAKAIDILLNYDMLSTQRDIHGMTIIDCAIHIKKFHYVESIVKRDTYLKDVLSAKFPQNGDPSAVSRLDNLLGKISSKALKRLIKIETRRMNIAICQRDSLGRTILWKLSQFLLWIPFNQRTFKSRKYYLQCFHILLNFYTYVRVTRFPLYKLCNPHSTGYINYKDTNHNTGNGRIALDFLLSSSHFLHNETNLISRLYVAMDPANENSVMARLARHEFNDYSLRNIVQNKPQNISMKAFLLGRSGQLDGCAVATSRMLWVAVEICATLLKMCLKLGMKNNLLGKDSKFQRWFHAGAQTPLMQTIQEETFEKYQELHSTCHLSFYRMLLQTLGSTEKTIARKLVFDNVEFVFKILSESPIRNDRHVERNLYLLKFCLLENETLKSNVTGVSPLENLIFSLQTYEHASSSLADFRYVTALINSPYISLFDQESIRNALNLLGEAVVYGYLKGSDPLAHKKGSLFHRPKSWHFVLYLLRHPTITFNNHRVFTYNVQGSLYQNNFSKPAIKLADNLWNKSYTDVSEAKWALGRLAGADYHTELPTSYSVQRPSSYILEVLHRRRSKIINILAKSQSIQYDEDFNAIHLKSLKIMCLFYFIRILSHTLKILIVSKEILGTQFARYAASTTVDFWDVVYPVHRGLRGFFFGVCCAFLCRLSSRNHPHGFLLTLLHCIELTGTIFCVVCLYAWTIWSSDWVFIYGIIFLQLIVAMLSWIFTFSLTNRSALILTSNFSPCSYLDFEKAVFLKKKDFLDWHYYYSAGIRDENELNDILAQEVKSTQLARYNFEKKMFFEEFTDSSFNEINNSFFCYNVELNKASHLSCPPFNDNNDIWERATDENVGDVMRITKELAGLPKKHFLQNISQLHHYDPWPYKSSSIKSQTVTNYNTLQTTMRERNQIDTNYDFEKRPVSNKDNLKLKRRKKKKIKSNDFDLKIVDKTTGSYSDSYRSKAKHNFSTSLFKENLNPCYPEFFKEQKKIKRNIFCNSLDENNYSNITICSKMFHKTESCRKKEIKPFGITPPEFLRQKFVGDDGKALKLNSNNNDDSNQVAYYEPLIFNEEVINKNLPQQFNHFEDVIRTSRQQKLELDSDVMDLGHISNEEFIELATQLNTMDYLVLLWRFKKLRRFTTQVFYAGIGKYHEYTFVVILFETIAFVCSIAPLLISLFAPPEYCVDFLQLYSNSFTYLSVKKLSSISILINVCSCHVYQRLLIEVIRSAALHILLSRQTYHIGSMFSWKALQPYLAINSTELMRGIWTIRQVACRKLDNMIELTSHQFNILVFGFLAAYPIFVFLLISIQDIVGNIVLFFHVYTLMVAVAITIIVATLIGFQGYKALNQFVFLTNWIHRIVEHTHGMYHPLIFLSNKNKLDPTLNLRYLSIMGFPFTMNVVIAVFILLLSASLLLGFLLLKLTFPEAQSTNIA